MDLGPDLLIGQPVFGGYVVTRAIGAGGMGEVYLIENVELGKQLVIKVLLPERSSSPQLVARFLAEARAASALRHPNIIQVLDSAKLPDGRYYILMEYLDGHTLYELVQTEGVQPAQVTLAILAPICSALHAAHDRGIVHRDIKPSNIFIAPDDDNPYFAKLLDFGIAKLEDPALAGDIVTHSVMIAGTPFYMSPEQARTLRDADHRADIYSVGAIAYEMLTGRVPYIAHSVGELVYQQSHSTPPAAIALRAEIPPEWSVLLERAISLEPGDRPQSAYALAKLMIAATPDGEQIARVVAPRLFKAPALPFARRRAPDSGASAAKRLGARPSPAAGVSESRTRSGDAARAESESDKKTRVVVDRAGSESDKKTRVVVDRGGPKSDVDDEVKTRVLPGRNSSGVSANVVSRERRRSPPSTGPRAPASSADRPRRSTGPRAPASGSSRSRSAAARAPASSGAAPRVSGAHRRASSDAGGKTKVLIEPSVASPASSPASSISSPVRVSVQQPAAKPTTLGMSASEAASSPGRSRAMPLLWVLIIASVIAAAIGTAIAIGLFTGPDRVPPRPGATPPGLPVPDAALPDAAQPDAAPPDATPGDAGPASQDSRPTDARTERGDAR